MSADRSALWISVTALVFGATLTSLPRSAAAEALSVPLSETLPLSLAGSASDVLVGDAAIVDVTVMDHHHLLIHGKAFGRTNLVVMDASGRTLFSSPIVVSNADDGHVSVFRGALQSDYSCAVRCERISGTGAGPSGPAAAVTAPLARAIGGGQ